MLRRRATEHPDRIAYRFLDYPGKGPPRISPLTYGQLDVWARAIAVTLGERSRPGDRVLLLCPPGPEYVAYLLGSLYARLVAVPAYPPTSARHVDRVRSIARGAQARLAVTGRSGDPVTSDTDPLGLDVPGLDWLAATDRLVDGRQESWDGIVAGSADLAFLQYTSGSTAEPKGVMVTHANVLANMRSAEPALAVGSEAVGVSWVPPHHDMGLLGGLIFPMYTGFPVNVMSPMAFLRDPARWLDAITRFGATVSAAPNFAYDLCCDRVADEDLDRLDLSTLACTLSGAEPVRPEVLDRFSLKFERCGFRRSAFFPCYGLAEGTALLSGARPPGEIPKVRLVSAPALETDGRVGLPEDVASARRLVGCGAVVDDTEILIVDPAERRVLPPGRIGELWVRGPTVAAGYFRAEEATRETFGATLADGDGPYLRTGDLGTFIEDYLFVTGRASDMMVFRGRNVHPQDVEAGSVASHPCLAGSRAVAFSIDVQGTERLVVVQGLVRPRVSAGDVDEITSAVGRAIAQEHGLHPHDVVLIPSKKIPVTSSGKLRRAACRASYLAGELPRVRPRADEAARPVSDPAPDQVAARLRLLVADAADRDSAEVDLDRPFTDYGLDSVHASSLAHRLSEWLGVEVPPTFVWDYPTIESAVRALTANNPGPATTVCARAGKASQSHFDPVAVVGMGCRFPGVSPGGGVGGFWDLLVRGGCEVTDVPAERWNVKEWFSPVMGEAGRVYARHGGFVAGLGGFDAELFGVSPREAMRMDPQQRLVLEVVWEALEGAGVAPDGLRGSRTGVFVGVAGSDWARLSAAAGVGAIDEYAATGSSVNFVANRVSYGLGLAGPSLAVDTACSSSLVAVHLAVQSLRGGECDLALAGGVNLLLGVDAWVALCQGRMLSASGLCRAFDEAADGYVRGEGCGIVVLKRLPDAVAAGDEVLAVIRGTAINHDGRSNGLTAPNGLAQQHVIRDALAMANVEPAAVGYVEAHGTGTPLGDPVEARALAETLGQGRPPDRPLMIGSVKTNIGHLEAAAGIAGLIKAVLAVKHGVVPPHPHLHRPNPHIAWDRLPLTIPTRPTPWDRPRRIAGISSFGFGGTNAHTVIDDCVGELTGDAP
ncbi:beta-ketoacyl synthase N-terminal-like domain-containing protein [Actinomadura fulvescens]|uniref:Polyketide synthase n=1 Tax=Actinomadura fulvescens TaxID=46160 RepID=A0ABN3QL20_9ACTN